MEPFIKFDSKVTRAGQMEILVHRIAVMELNLKDLDEEIDKKTNAARRANSALSSVRARRDALNGDLQQAAWQLRKLLPPPTGWELAEMAGLVIPSSVNKQEHIKESIKEGPTP